jgi:hypothetical protein
VPLAWILSLVGFGYLGYAIHQMAQNFSQFAVMATAIEFAVPIILSFLYLPFLYAFGVYAVYEAAFVSLMISIPDVELRRFAKIHAALAFNFRPSMVRLWTRSLFTVSPASKEASRASIDAIKLNHRKD